MQAPAYSDPEAPTAILFDGRTAAAQQVHAVIDGQRLRIVAPGGEPEAFQWISL